MEMVTAHFRENTNLREEHDIANIMRNDIAVWSDERPDLKDALIRWNELLMAVGLMMNVEKMEIIKKKYK